MSIFKMWIDIILVAAAMTLVKGAITGTFYSTGRGGGRTFFANVKSVPARIALLLVALGIFAWLIIDLRQNIHI